MDCARRTQVYKGRVGATPREGTRISNLSNRGDLRNAGAQMVLLCFAPVKRDDALEEPCHIVSASEIEMHQSQGLERPGWAYNPLAMLSPPLAISIWSVK